MNNEPLEFFNLLNYKFLLCFFPAILPLYIPERLWIFGCINLDRRIMKKVGRTWFIPFQIIWTSQINYSYTTGAHCSNHENYWRNEWALYGSLTCLVLGKGVYEWRACALHVSCLRLTWLASSITYFAMIINNTVNEHPLKQSSTKFMEERLCKFGLLNLFRMKPKLTLSMQLANFRCDSLCKFLNAVGVFKPQWLDLTKLKLTK